MKLKNLLCALIGLAAFSTSMGATFCNGTVTAVYKYNYMTTMSIKVLMNDGTTTNWINMPTKSDEAMALVALTNEKPITLYWISTDVIACANGWAHNRTLEGYMMITN